MLFGRDALQVVTTVIYLLTMTVIVYKLWRYRRSCLAFVPLAINVGLTIVFYAAVFAFEDNAFFRFGDLSAALRLETGLTLLIYAAYMPIGKRTGRRL